MEVGQKVKVKSVPGETLYQHFIGSEGKIGSILPDGKFKVEFEGRGLMFLEKSQIEPV